MKKYIFLDIDGTLYDSNKHASDENIKALQKIIKKGAEIVFCSGRDNFHLHRLSQMCHCSRYLISSNGSMIYDQEKEKIIYSQTIPYSILKDIYSYCENNKIAITFNTDKYRYCNKYVKKNKYFNSESTKLLKSLDEIVDKTVVQFVVGSYDYEKMMIIYKYIENISDIKIVNISTTLKFNLRSSKDGFFYDVVKEGISKGSGVRNFREIFNIAKKDCIAIGDHINDLEVFDEVGYKIAMGNGYDELKNRADFVTKSNDEDGIKYALEYLEDKILRI